MTYPVCSESAMVPPKEGATFVSPLAALQVRDPLPKGVTGLPPTSAEPGKRIWPPSMAAQDMHPGSAASPSKPLGRQGESSPHPLASHTPSILPSALGGHAASTPKEESRQRRLTA